MFGKVIKLTHLRCKTQTKLMGLIIICMIHTIFQKLEVLDFLEYFFQNQQSKISRIW